jgi:CRP-like cAMP-binding protein
VGRAIDEFLQKLSTNVALFNGLDVTRLERLVTGAERVSVPKDRLFSNRGDTGSHFFILLKGQAIVEKKDGHLWAKLAQLEPGETFGEMALIDGEPRSARIRALEDCVSLSFDGRKIDAHPEIAATIYKNIARLQVKRVRHSNFKAVAWAKQFADRML